MWFIWSMLATPISDLRDLIPFIVHAVPFLLASSAFAIAGFLTTETMKEKEAPRPMQPVQPLPSITQQTIVCPHCGQQIPAESIFCPYCGQKIA